MLGESGIIMPMNNATTRENTMAINTQAAQYVISALWAEQVADLKNTGLEVDEDHGLTSEECVEWLKDILTGEYAISWAFGYDDKITICLR